MSDENTMTLREAAQVAALAADLAPAMPPPPDGQDPDPAAEGQEAETTTAILEFAGTLREKLADIDGEIAEFLAQTHVEVPIVESEPPQVAPDAEKPDVPPPPGFTPQ